MTQCDTKVTPKWFYNAQCHLHITKITLYLSLMPSFTPFRLSSFLPSSFHSSTLPSILTSFNLSFFPAFRSFPPFLLASLLPSLHLSLPAFLHAFMPCFLHPLPPFLPSFFASFLLSFLTSFLPVFSPSLLPSRHLFTPSFQSSSSKQFKAVSSQRNAKPASLEASKPQSASAGFAKQ